MNKKNDDNNNIDKLPPDLYEVKICGILKIL